MWSRGALAVLLFAANAHAADASLDEALRATELIVTVKLDEPASTTVEIPVGAADAPCDPYRSSVFTGVVEAVLHPKDMHLTWETARIVVFRGNTPELVRLSADACGGGANRSVQLRRFDQKRHAEPTDGATLTVLLRWAPDIGWVEAIAGSWLAAPPSAAELARARTFRSIPFHMTKETAEGEANPGLCVADADCIKATLGCSACPPCADQGPPMASAVKRRYQARCFESLGRPPSPCGPCSPDKWGEETRVACREMRCVEVQREPKAKPKSKAKAAEQSVAAPGAMPPSTAMTSPNMDAELEKALHIGHAVKVAGTVRFDHSGSKGEEGTRFMEIDTVNDARLAKPIRIRIVSGFPAHGFAFDALKEDSRRTLIGFLRGEYDGIPEWGAYDVGSMWAARSLSFRYELVVVGDETHVVRAK